jgi:hypothetical protein
MKTKHIAAALLILWILAAPALAQDTPGTVKFPAGLDSADSLFRAADSASSTLSGSITNSATSLVLTSAAKFPSSGAVVIENEVIYYTGKSSNTLMGCMRAQEGTAAAAHGTGVPVRLPILSSQHNAVVASLVASQRKLGTGDSVPSVGKVLKGVGAGASAWGNLDVLAGDVTVEGGLNVMGAITGNGAGITGLAGATGGVSNTGSTTIGADTDANAVGKVSIQTANIERIGVEADGAIAITPASDKLAIIKGFADKCGQACNVKSYGAVGDGVADDTTAIQATVNAVRWIRGGVVNASDGHFKITTPVVLPRVQQFGVYSTVTIYAYGAVFEPTAAASSVFYYHPSSQTENDAVIYGSVRIFGAQFKAATRTPGQTAIDISACEGCRYQDIDVVNMNGIHGRTNYRTIAENVNVHITNEFGIKFESGDWPGATPFNSPSNANLVKNCRVIPGSGSQVSIWFINSDLSGVEGPSIHDAPDVLYPGSGSPVYEIFFDNSAYPLGQTNFVRDWYSERPSNPTGAVIGAALYNGTLTLDLIRRYDDATGVVYVDATGSTPNSTIMLRAWPRMDDTPTVRFKTSTGVQWMFDHVGEAGNRNFLNSAWWASGVVGAVSQWGLNGIVVSGAGSSGTGVPAFQLGRYGSSAEATFGISRGPDFFLLGTASGDTIIRAADRTKNLILGVGDATGGNDKPVLTIDGGAVGVGATGILILENGVPRRVSVSGNDTCGSGFRCLRIPN